MILFILFITFSSSFALMALTHHALWALEDHKRLYNYQNDILHKSIKCMIWFFAFVCIMAFFSMLAVGMVRLMEGVPIGY